MRWGVPSRPQNARARSLLVAVVAILLLFGTTLQLTHVHSDGASHQDCALCQSIHNVVRPSITPSIGQAFIFIAPVAAPLTRQHREHLFSYSHWNRPPPDRTA